MGEQHKITVIIPTLGRKTLQKAIDALKAQTVQADFIILDGPKDPLTKMKEGVEKTKTEVLVMADDDAEFPKDWMERLLARFEEDVGYVGGPCLPLLDESSNDAERCIAEVTSSFWGTSNMSYRWKIGNNPKPRNADETNLVGVGMYRTDLTRKILEDFPINIPGWEDEIFMRMKQLGFKTIFAPGGFFYHRQRPNIFAFAKQIFRSGTGRVTFFRRFPKQLFPKFWVLGPAAFVLYLALFFGFAFANFPIIPYWPLTLYVAFLTIISFGLNKHKSKWLWAYYLTMHLSYGIGMIVGLFRQKNTWS